MVFGIERFHTYLYGASFVVESDHKPLQSIQLKNLSQAPPRLQRMLLRIQPYDATIVYRPGKELKLADGLSRLNPRPGDTIRMDSTIHAVRWSSQKIDRLRELTDSDPVLTVLRDTIHKGWPEKAQDLPKSIRSFWSVKDFLSVENGIILKGVRILVPESLQKEILNTLHTSHQGIEKTRLLARTCVYWNNIDKDISDMIGQCDTCLEYSRSQKKESLMPHDVPSGPWQKIGSDLFDLDRVTYLIVSDYYSKMTFIRRLNSETSSAVIGKLKTIISEHGIPTTLHSDGGPCYNNFTEHWGIKHVKSSPHYPQSNGFIERMVQTTKNIMRKANKTGIDPELALLQARITPTNNQLPSPSQLLYGWNIVANLPTSSPGDESVVDNLVQRQNTQKTSYDRKGVYDLPNLSVGQSIGFQDPHTLRWKKGKVANKCEEPRSYIIRTPEGASLRRNRIFLKKLNPVDNTSEAAQPAEIQTTEGENTVANTTRQATPKKTVTFNKQVEICEKPDRPRRVKNKPRRLIETI